MPLNRSRRMSRRTRWLIGLAVAALLGWQLWLHRFGVPEAS